MERETTHLISTTHLVPGLLFSAYTQTVTQVPSTDSLEPLWEALNAFSYLKILK